MTRCHLHKRAQRGHLTVLFPELAHIQSWACCKQKKMFPYRKIDLLLLFIAFFFVIKDPMYLQMTKYISEEIILYFLILYFLFKTFWLHKSITSYLSVSHLGKSECRKKYRRNGKAVLQNSSICFITELGQQKEPANSKMHWDYQSDTKSRNFSMYVHQDRWALTQVCCLLIEHRWYERGQLCIL